MNSKERGQAAMGLASQIAALERPDFVFVDDDTAVMGAGRDDLRSGDLALIDDVFTDGRFWCVSADYRGAVRCWRPRTVSRGPRPPAVPITAPTTTTPADDAGRDAYAAAVERALVAINSGAVSKLVVARQLRFSLDAALDLPRLVEGLLAHHGCSVYVVDDGDSLFFGASPERLLRRRGDVIEVDCVAGTRAAGDAQALLGSEKDRREHQAVVDGVVAAIGGVASATTIITRGPLAHLGAVVRATSSLSPAAQLQKLHPTAATAGTPRDRAIALLDDIEGFDRGSYAGFVGFVDGGVCSFAVTLRCARVVGRDVVVTTGAGVVAGSDPQSEWRETQQKARVLWPALMHAVRDGARP